MPGVGVGVGVLVGADVGVIDGVGVDVGVMVGVTSTVGTGVSITIGQTETDVLIFPPKTQKLYKPALKSERQVAALEPEYTKAFGILLHVNRQGETAFV